MSIIVGIDTGGTHTDAVLMDSEKEEILQSSKVLTTHSDLSVGIKECLELLLKNFEDNIDRVMLSTTLATNSVVEEKGQKVGVIFIGKKSYGVLPSSDIAIISGTVNVKGREIAEIDESKIDEALKTFSDNVGAIVVSGFMSVRNPAQEIFVREYINRKYNLPIVCGHELSTELGFHERTVTAILNARLLPVISDFLTAIERVLKDLSIKTEIFIVKGDGSVSNTTSVLREPVETILSGPTTSIIGAKYLTKINNCIVCDMGGTTTDTSYLNNGKVSLTENGAKVGEWKTRIRSLDIHTYGLGGDSKVVFGRNEDMVIGPESALPTCRGGTFITPTDILHCVEDIDFGDKKLALSAIHVLSNSLNKTSTELTDSIEEKIVDLIQEECIGPWNKKDVPVIAIGAAAKMWLGKWSEIYGYELVVPNHYEVASAVGAAMASIRITVKAIIRPGEKNYGFVAHLKTKRKLFVELNEAITYSVEESKKDAKETAKLHGAKDIELITDRKDVYIEDSHEKNIYIETKIQVTAIGKNI